MGATVVIHALTTAHIKAPLIDCSLPTYFKYKFIVNSHEYKKALLLKKDIYVNFMPCFRKISVG